MDKIEVGKVNYARRGFLNAAKGVGALGAIAVLMGRTATAEAATEPPASAEPATGGGYRETEHIRKYYYCARYW
jgi:hypothetical protein